MSFPHNRAVLSGYWGRVGIPQSRPLAAGVLDLECDTSDLAGAAPAPHSPPSCLPTPASLAHLTEDRLRSPIFTQLPDERFAIASAHRSRIESHFPVEGTTLSEAHDFVTNERSTGAGSVTGTRKDGRTVCSRARDQYRERSKQGNPSSRVACREQRVPQEFPDLQRVESTGGE